MCRGRGGAPSAARPWTAGSSRPYACLRQGPDPVEASVSSPAPRGLMLDAVQGPAMPHDSASSQACCQPRLVEFTFWRGREKNVNCL